MCCMQWLTWSHPALCQTPLPPRLLLWLIFKPNINSTVDSWLPYSRCTYVQISWFTGLCKRYTLCGRERNSNGITGISSPSHIPVYVEFGHGFTPPTICTKGLQHSPTEVLAFHWRFQPVRWDGIWCSKQRPVWTILTVAPWSGVVPLLIIRILCMKSPTHKHEGMFPKTNFEAGSAVF